MTFKQTLVTLTGFLLALGMGSTYACTCVSKPNQTLKNELSLVDVVVKGKIIRVTDYTDATFPWHYRRFTLIVEKKYKAPANTADTVSILTGRDSDACGYAFKLGKDYIVYGTIWVPSKADNRSLPQNKDTYPVFFTDICFFTKEANRSESAKLRRLTRSRPVSGYKRAVKFISALPSLTPTSASAAIRPGGAKQNSALLRRY